MSGYRAVRILLLLIILLLVSVNTWLSQTRTTDWQEPLWAVVYPIAADQLPITRLYVNALSEDHFEDMERFMAREAQRYGVVLDKPLEVKLAPPLEVQPPEPPQNQSVLSSIIWSLKMRYWAWNNDNWQGPEPDIKIYMRFFTPDYDRVLAHSLGLQKGMIGVVNGFASIDYQARNNFVAAHELLHTLGATDKYDPRTSFPLWPDGYADPDRKPLLPQSRAEIMGGRVQVSAGWALMPKSLKQAVVGERTAREIQWLSP
ncbi:hypothetical protein [Marinobacterium jannaschii]|uniref:hypothetical protein n=1 Tax=Marinobacterium jannaschii TaxID=64970 RepID=UPI0004810E37|nr:hypothetical protein [Marinobacterium jannaschii]